MSSVNEPTPADATDVEAVDSCEFGAVYLRAATEAPTASAGQMTAGAGQNAGTPDSVTEKPKLDDTVECDAFLKDWDMTIRTCPHCQRPFGTPERLSKHQAEWISASCVAKEPRYENPAFDESDIEDLVPGADLIVSVDDGKTARRFRVPSQVLATASRCFQVSFGPTAQFESANEVRRAAIRGNCPAIIDLDDNLVAMELVLKILCFRHLGLPHTLEFRSIVDIAVIADKYELDQVLRTWVKYWLEPFQSELFNYRKPTSGSNGKIRTEPKLERDWLFISWVFGFRDAFVQITRLLSFVDADLSHLCTQTPGLVLEHLQALRTSRGDKLRQCFKGIQSKFEKGHSFCVKASQKVVCNTLHLGHLANMVSKHQLDKNETWDGNLVDLAAKIDRMPRMNMWDPLMCYRCTGHPGYRGDNCPDCSHASCGWLTELKDMASTCIKEDLHLNLLDFPSRVERMKLCSWLDSSVEIRQSVTKV